MFSKEKNKRKAEKTNNKKKIALGVGLIAATIAAFKIKKNDDKNKHSF